MRRSIQVLLVGGERRPQPGALPVDEVLLAGTQELGIWYAGVARSMSSLEAACAVLDAFRVVRLAT